ncbi:hypothetical protein MIND_00793200 [Mycena indigotica]|uniref:non-specific serine/threonine protein kinase n=1 Tax=Mycena indigotica TaxID=2126181 RepID=A0A8H6SPA2_9AGAR|nr:uncharacterized protein MIND_00793200 [Mycena indigotica]KAF7302261.1 hypothetical protein MIND_00793200 [Mycena indigotica]
MESIGPTPTTVLHDVKTDSQPPNFLVFLEHVAQTLQEAGELPRPEADYANVVEGLSEQFLAAFPSPATSMQWSLLDEKVRLVVGTLRLIRLASLRVHTLYHGPTLARTIFIRLLNLSILLEWWQDEDIGEENGVMSPHELQKSAMETASYVLRILGDSKGTFARSPVPLWKTMREIMMEGSKVVSDILARSAILKFPVAITLFASVPVKDQSTPSSQDSNITEQAFTVTIESADHIATFLANTLLIIAQALHPSPISHWSTVDIARQVTESIAQTVFFCTSPFCASSLESRVRTALKLIRVPLEFSRHIPNLPLHLLRYRLLECPHTGWDAVDVEILETFRAMTFVSPPLGDIKELLSIIKSSGWGQMSPSCKALVVGYTSCCVTNLPIDVVRLLRQLLPHGLEWARVRKDIAGKMAMERQTLVGASSWRHQLKGLTQEIIFPLTIDWMEGEEGMGDNDYAQRALDDIASRFSRELMDSDAESRFVLIDKMSTCLCSAGGCDSSGHVHSKTRFLLSLDATVVFVARVIDGPANEATNRVKRRALNVLAVGMHHHCGDLPGPMIDRAWNLVWMGIADLDRNVRLAAGSALAAFIELYVHKVADAVARLPSIFEQLREVVRDNSTPVAETLFIAVGSLGRIQHFELLGQALTFLIGQLGNSNPVLKGTACMQLLAIAEHHNKTIYALSLPHFHEIAPFLVLRLYSQPGLLVEACRLLNTRPQDFIEINLARTLPYVFAHCDDRAMQEVAQILHKKPSVVLLRHTPEILAHIFLLPGQGQTEKSLACLLKVLRDSANKTEIDLHSVVKSSIVQLLALLVVVLGDEDPRKADCALPALKKVEKVMMNGDHDLLESNLSHFLKNYMLGVVTDVNDMLRDARGKIQLVTKRRILKSLGLLVSLIGAGISNVAPQIMATFQTMVVIPELSEVTLQSWHTFLSAQSTKDIGPHVGPTSAAFVASWPALSPNGRVLARECLEYIVIKCGSRLGSYLDDVVELDSVPELERVATRLKELRSSWSPKEELENILERVISDNLTVTTQSLGELKTFMRNRRKDLISGLASGDIFDPLIGKLLSALFSAASREGDGTESARLLAFECIGALGAVDPDRFEIGVNPSTMVMVTNFTSDDDSLAFVLHLIKDVLVGAFRSTSDIRYQNQLAYCIQELLKFCKFTPALIGTGHNSVPVKVRNRWNSLPKHVIETAAPLLDGRFVPEATAQQTLTHPLYPRYPTYREWLQWWTFHLISRVTGNTAKAVFSIFRQAVRNKDVVVAHHLLPHLVLNVILSGTGDDASDIRNELQVVLQDQVDKNSESTDDKKLLSAQVVFTLLDHLNKWVRLVRQEVSHKKADLKRPRHANADLEDQLMRVDSILSNIDQHLMARAALKCKAYARSLMNFEWQIATAQSRSAKRKDLNEYYERLHEIYSHLDEPDGMEGMSTLILEPTLEHQIRQHESTGHWTSAQSCWEVRLQQSPDNLDFHLGLLRCLRNLGHYDTLRTHVRGVLTRNPSWQEALAGYQVESAWMVGAWSDVQELVDRTKIQNPSIVMARVLLAMRLRDPEAITTTLSVARSILGTPIAAAGPRGYRRAYDAVMDLHRTHELELIYEALNSLPTGSQRRSQKRQQIITQLQSSLAGRLESTLPTFRAREPILSMRRTAFGLIRTPGQTSEKEIGRSWLASAKIARKAGQWQTAYSAMLQARQSNANFAFMESAKLVKATGEPLRALQELENSMRTLGLLDDKPDIMDLTEDDDEAKLMKAKVQVLRARWMNESERYDSQAIFSTFFGSTELQPDWESCHFHLGRFHDDCFKNLSKEDQASRGLRMNASTVKSYARAIRNGSKYVYQTVPRLLTIWLDLAEDPRTRQQQTFQRMNDVISKIIRDAPVYKWYTAFPQIVSRVGHGDNQEDEVYKNLARLIGRVLEEYPKQALWLFMAVVKSTKKERQMRGQDILKRLKNNPSSTSNGVAHLVNECEAMTFELLNLCDYPIRDGDDGRTLSMRKTFPNLFKRGKSDLIIPLQESLTASLPPTSALASEHQPFPPDAPTFEGMFLLIIGPQFFDEIEVMRSLAKPRKITMRGSNGQIYMFLGKPKDDLRKDARLMDFNAILNKLLKSNSESRRRQLRIRTYGVVTLNEECGFIQWVPNTTPLRPVLMKRYDAMRIKSWGPEMNEIFGRIKHLPDKEAGELFRTKILSMFPPLFHDWFIEMFPEPSAWLASRLAYGRTAAVMSMVGFILGLGDRHSENILLDVNTGDIVHVDFNCLFEKGKTLETPERVPFRLTQNLVDGLGVTGVEGVFRIACEVTLQLLRDNKDVLMSVLDAFIHDPLVEWEDEKRKREKEKETRSGRNTVKPSVDLRMLGKDALKPIERKLKGLYSPTTAKERPTSSEKEVSTENMVQMLIQEATELANLAKMYPGWASWH